MERYNKIQFGKDKQAQIVDFYYNKKMTLDEIGKVFGISRTPIKRVLIRNNISLRENKPRIGRKNIKCSETRKRLFSEGKLIYPNPMKNKHHSQETRDKLSILNSGENNKFYGKIHSLATRIKISANKRGIKIEDWNNFSKNEEYDPNWNIHFKNEIRKRDNQICLNCGIHREKLKQALTIHHINYDKKCSMTQNCISLCKVCHALTNYNREYWSKLFQAKLSKLYGYKYQDGKIILELNYGEKI